MTIRLTDPPHEIKMIDILKRTIPDARVVDSEVVDSEDEE
jgi:hypothetical protein